MPAKKTGNYVDLQKNKYFLRFFNAKKCVSPQQVDDDVKRQYFLFFLEERFVQTVWVRNVRF